MQPQIHNIGVYDFLMVKGRLTGCGLHGDSLVSFLFNRQYNIPVAV